MKMYIADAFTEEVFRGNPAAICVMDKLMSDEKMLAVAAENNLSETAFIVKEGEYYLMDVVNVSGGEFIMKVQKVFRKYAVLIIIVISNN